MYFAQLGSRFAMPPEIVTAPPFPPDDEEPPFDDDEDDEDDEEDEEDEEDEVPDPPVLEEIVEIGTQITPLRVYPLTQVIHCPLNKL